MDIPAHYWNTRVLSPQVEKVNSLFLYIKMLKSLIYSNVEYKTMWAEDHVNCARVREILFMERGFTCQFLMMCETERQETTMFHDAIFYLFLDHTHFFLSRDKNAF